MLIDQINLLELKIVRNHDISTKLNPVYQVGMLKLAWADSSTRRNNVETIVGFEPSAP